MEDWKIGIFSLKFNVVYLLDDGASCGWELGFREFLSDSTVSYSATIRVNSGFLFS